MDNLIKGAVNKIKQFATNTFKAAGPALQSYATAYGKVSPYIPLAPKLQTPQQAMQNYQNIGNTYNKLPTPVKKFGEGFVESSSMGLYDMPAPKSQNNWEKAGYVGGYAAGILNPLNPANKIFGALNIGERIAAPAIAKIAPKATGFIATKLLPNIAGEATQTAGYMALKNLSERANLTPKSEGGFGEQLAFGLLGRGAFGLAGKVIPGQLKVQAGKIGDDDVKALGAIMKRASENWMDKGKANLNQYAKDIDLVDEILVSKYGATKEELKKIPEIDRVKNLFQMAMEDYRGFQLKKSGLVSGITEQQPSFKVKATPDGKIKVKIEKQDITPDILKTRSAPPPSVPPGKAKVKGLPTREEVAATLNDKIDLLLENTAGYSTKAPTGGEKGASLYTRILRGAEGKLASTVEKGMVSQNPLIRRASSVLHGLFKEFGMSPEHMKQALEFKGGLSTANQQAYDVMDSLYQALGNNPQSKARIDAVLDPEASKLKVSFNDLDETEKAVYSLIRQGYDLIHDISYADGGISPEVYKKNLGKYSPFLIEKYEVPEEVNKFISQSPKRLQTDLYRKKGSLTEWKKENKLDDPIYALGKRLSQVESNRAVKRYTDFIASQPHLVSDVARPGFTQLSDSPAYGSLRGKYVANSAMEELKGYFFANKGLQALYDVFREYDKLPLRQLQKKLLTVFNPTTNVGNITTDNVFGFLVGVDPFTLNKNIVNFKRNPSEYRKIANYLMSQGITGTDITRSDFISKIGSIDELQKGTKLNIADKIKEFYGGTDDVYKAAAFKSLLDQGKTLQEATTLVADGFQNYANVGKLYDLASKTPIIGQPFIKFQGDLVRIMKNAAVNKPLQLIQFLAALKAISILSSKASGETDEQRIARENRFGANKIPGLDISLQWQTPMGEINIARYISPFYTTNLSENTTTQALNKFVPFSPEIIKDSTGKLDVAGTISANANDPFTSVPIQFLADRDFRNKPISDPKASKFFGSDLPADEQMKNKLIWAGRQYLPPAVNTAIDIKAAAEGKPDLYGKQRTVPQAIARALGVKVEQVTPEIVKKQAETSKYFEAQGPAFNTLKAQEKAAVLSIPKQEPDDTKDKVYKYTTMLQYPAVYNYMKDIAIGKAGGDMKKVDPLYTYSYSDIRKYMTYQALGGSDYGSADAKALYKAEPVIAQIAKARSEYFKANPIEGAAQSSRPIASAYAQQQMSVGNWNDPQVKAFLEANNAWKNMQREKAGLPPLESLGGYSKFGAYTKKPKKVAIKAVKKIKTKKFTVKLKSPKLKALKKTVFKVTKVKQPKIKVKMPRLA